jgi:DNA polymerase-3 subunit beta
LLDIGDDSTVEATNLEISVRYKISGVDCEEPGQFLLPFAEIVSVLRELKDDEVRITYDGQKAQIATAKSKFSFSCLDVHDFPRFDDTIESSIWISAGELSRMIKLTSFATASEGTVYAVQSVCFEVEGESGVFVTTDRRRIALCPGKIRTNKEEKIQLLLNPKAVSILSKSLIVPEDEVSIGTDGDKVVFRLDRMTLMSRLVEGRYPQYQAAIPKQNPVASVCLTVDSFSSALRQSKVFVTEQTNCVQFNFSEGLLKLSSFEPGQIGESEIEEPIVYDAEDFEVLFDPQLMLDMLRTMDGSDTVWFDLHPNSKPCVFRKDDYQYVVVPVVKT